MARPPLDTSNNVLWLADDTVHSGTGSDWSNAVAPGLGRLFADAGARFPVPFDVKAVDNGDVEQKSLEDCIGSLSLPAYERDALEGALSGLVHAYSEHGIAQLLHGVAAHFGDYRAYFQTAGSWAIQGGIKRLVDAILAESTAELRLSTPVRSISDDGARVTLTTGASDKIHACAAIVALPITLRDVAITPDVPRPVRAMLDQGNPVMAGKIWARVRGHVEPFAAFALAGKHPISMARTECRLGRDTLIFCMCADAAAIRADDHGAVQAALQTFVPGIYVVDTASHDWVADEFSKGTWIHYHPGHFTAGASRMRQPHGRLRFAGADIAAIGIGAIDGAMESGAVAARDVAAALAKGEY